MNSQQCSQSEVSEEVCKEIVRETISLIGDAGNTISGILSSFLSYVMAVLTVVIFFSTIYSETLKYTNEILKYINIPEQCHVLIYLVSILIFSIIAIFIIRHKMIEIGLRHAEIARDALAMVLYCRERLFHACQEKLCKSEQQGQYCIDISILLASIKKMENLLKKDYSKLCETIGKTTSSTPCSNLKTNQDYGE